MLHEETDQTRTDVDKENKKRGSLGSGPLLLAVFVLASVSSSLPPHPSPAPFALPARTF